MSDALLATERLSAMYGKRTVVRDVSLSFAPRMLHAIIGPAQSGKSTFLRTLDRMHEISPGGWITGRVLLGGEEIHSPRVDPAMLRRRIGMVFSHATPFPARNVLRNVMAGLPVDLPLPAREEAVARALTRAGLWDELKDRLSADPRALSPGQRQRLCLARALATEPEVLLLDEPTATLDPGSSFKLEEALYGLRSELCVVLVTHDARQAARIADTTTLLWLGAVVETAPSRLFFTRPSEARTESWLTGRSA